MGKIKIFCCYLAWCSVLCCSKKEDPVLSTQNLTNKKAVIERAKAGSLIKIACEGTSLTYGEDIKGTDTVSAATGFNGGPTRAMFQYPQSLALGIRTAKVTLSIRGFPGDRTTEALTRWQDSTTADICIIEYGTNDAYNFLGYASGIVPVNIYKTQLEQLVQRRIDQGAWVVLCIPPYLESGDRLIGAYRSAASQVAHELSLDVFDIESSIAELSSPYSDVVHFNSSGYRKWGVDMMSIIHVIE